MQNKAFVSSVWAASHADVAFHHFEVPILKIEKMESTVKSFAKKCPKCFHNVRMCGRATLQLPIFSFSEEIKCSNVWLEMTLKGP